MHNITLIGTHHSEIGKCNSNELYKILESINPEVIFEELPSNLFDILYSDSFDRFYINNTLLSRRPPDVPPETKCIKKYLQNHNIKNIPVDIDVNPELSAEVEMMRCEFNKHDDVFKKLVNEAQLLIAQYGFDYLNSKKYLGLCEEIEIRKKQLIESNRFCKDEVLCVYKLFHEEILDKRENAMLENIYNYSKENQYNQAVFLIGAGHGGSIIKKIREYEKVEEIKLNWTIYCSASKLVMA